MTNKIIREKDTTNKNLNCTVGWPSSKSDILEVTENIGSGKCVCKLSNKKKIIALWYKIISLFHIS